MMDENEHKDNEKVLYKTSGKLHLTHNQFEEVDCLITESHVIIDNNEEIKIPVVRIEDFYIRISSSAIYVTRAREPFTSTATLIYIDDLQKKHKLSLEMQVADMDRFKLEIDKHLAEKQPKPELKTEGRVRLLGWLQLAVSGVIFILFLRPAIQGQLNVLAIILFAFAIGLNFFAGYFSIKRKVLGYWLSIINQSLQTLSFAIGSYLYNYSGIGGVYFYHSMSGEASESGFTASINPGFAIGWGVHVQTSYLAIDILAIFFIGVLLSALEFVKRENS
jgi:hypothetical protein